jgi:serine/threonine-protein kinase RsbW
MGEIGLPALADGLDDTPEPGRSPASLDSALRLQVIEVAVPVVRLRPAAPPDTLMGERFTREISSLEAIFAFLGERARAMELDEQTSFVVKMAVEELFTNMVKYNRNGRSDITVGVVREGNEVTVHMEDADSEPFDITALQEVDTTAPLHERRPGGLGIHLVRRLMDEVHYDFNNRRTTIRLVKHIS